MKRLFSIIWIIVSAFVWMAGCRTKDTEQVDENSKDVSSLKAIEGRWEGDIKIPNQPFPKRYIRKKEILNYLYSKR